MANVTLRLVKGSPLTNSEVDNNFSNLNIFKTEIGGDLGGNVFYPTVIGLQGRSVSNTAPENSQVLSWSVSSNAWIAANAVASYNELTTKPAVNVSITGDLTGSSNVVLTNTNTNNLSINVSYDYDNLDSRFLKLHNPTTQHITSYIEFQGNVTFSGNVTTISANNLIIEDNFIYLSSNNFVSNDDFGFVGNYNDGIYAHSGFFRDASDNGTWKIFEGYLPEPDTAVNIDTDNVSFRLANLAINTLTANAIQGIVSANLVTNLNADLLDGQQGVYYTNYTNQSNKPAANIVVSGAVTGTANVLLVANTNIITIVTTSNSNANVTHFNVNASNAVIATSIYGGSIYSGGSPVWTSSNDGAGSGLDADLLDGQDSVYYTNYVNQNNKPFANIVLAGNITGSGNAILNANTNIITVTAEVAQNSVTLGTHTIGRYIANVESGTAIIVTGGGTEDSVATVSHADTSTLSGVQGGAGVASITVDGLGHITAVTAATYLEQPGLNVLFTGDVTGSANINLTNVATNLLTIPLTVSPNSVTLGTDTTGNYVANVEAGAGLLASGGGSEGSTITVSHADTSSVSNVTSDNSGGVVLQDISLGFDTYGHVTAASVATANLDTRYLGISAKAADSDLLDGQDGTYYTNYNNLTNKPAANILLTGDVSGSANAVLTAGGTVLSITTTIQPNSVALGTDTTGNYTDRVISGTGISVSGTGDEGNVITVGLTNTAVTPSTYGNATIIPVITVDAQGRLTSVSNVALSAIGTSTDQQILYNDEGNVVGSPGLTYDGTSIKVNGNLESVYQSGDEGGEIFLKNAITNTSITNGVTIDVYQNKLRFFENGGTNRGFYLDITSGNAAVATNLFGGGGGGSGTTNYSDLTNKPAANIILTGDVTGSANALLTANSTVLSITTTIQPNSVTLGTDTTGNYVDRVEGANITVTGTADEGNVITISVPQAISPSSDLQFRNVTLSGNLSLPAVANIIGSTTLTLVGTTQATSSSTGELVVQGGIGAGGNIWAAGNIIAANNFSTRFIASSNSSYFVEPAGSNSVIVAGNVYTNQRIGFMNVNTTVSVVYQYYNANTNSLDTVFG